MPEIKNNFSQGKMNKDLDERLIPKGQYRDAMNIQVSTSEESDVGTAQNILGNAKVENIIGGNWNAVGTIADEKNNKLYWLAHNATRDAIFEYNLEDNTTVPVIIDNNMDVLKFNGSLITGINIVDDILMWTDNVNEPRKINITRCIQGFGAAACLSVGRTVISDCFKRSEAAKQMSKMTALMAVIPILCYIFGGFLADFLGWRYNLIALASMSLLLFVYMLIKLEETLLNKAKSVRIINMLNIQI